MQFLNPDSKFMAAFTLLADIVIVNMLLIVASLPVVTGGAALRAANAVVGDMVQGKGARYGLAFIRQLTVRWRAVSLYWLLLIIAGAFLVYQQFVVFQAGIEGVALTVIQALALAGAFIIAGISVWFFALASLPTEEDEPAFGALFAVSIQHTFRFLGRTVIAVGIFAAAGWLAFKLPLAVSVPFLFFFIPAVALYLVRLLIALPLGQELGD